MFQNCHTLLGDSDKHLTVTCQWMILIPYWQGGGALLPVITWLHWSPSGPIRYKPSSAVSGLHCGGPRFCWSSRDGNQSVVSLEQLGRRWWSGDSRCGWCFRKFLAEAKRRERGNNVKVIRGQESFSFLFFYFAFIRDGRICRVTGRSQYKYTGVLFPLTYVTWFLFQTFLSAEILAHCHI